MIQNLLRSGHKRLSARSFACTAHSLASHYSLWSRGRCAHSFAHSFAPNLVGQWNIFVWFSKCPESLWSYNIFLKVHITTSNIRLHHGWPTQPMCEVIAFLTFWKDLSLNFTKLPWSNLLADVSISCLRSNHSAHCRGQHLDCTFNSLSMATKSGMEIT